jgi:hypothetical protein
MKKEIAFGFLFFMSILFLNFISADDYQDGQLSVSVDILEPYALIDISPSSIHLGQVTKGYETSVQNITARNLGTLNVRIQPSLKYDADNFFNYLEFASASCSTWSNITRWTSSIIYGQGKSGDTYHFCMKMDLGDYESVISQDFRNLTTELTFSAMPA